MSELKTTSLSHKDNNTGTPNITMYPDGTTSLNYAATAFKNQLINSDFRIWQRGTPPLNTPSSYTADRWYVNGIVATSQRQVFNNPPGTTFGFDMLSGSAGNMQVRQAVELPMGAQVSPAPFSSGTTWTFSLWSTQAPSVQFDFADGVNGGNTVDVLPMTALTSTGETSGAYTKYLTTFTIAAAPNTASNLCLAMRIQYAAAAGGESWVIAGPQLEQGPVATSLEQRPMAMELSLCQRYYQRINFTRVIFNGNSSSGTTTARASAYSEQRAVATVTNLDGEAVLGHSGGRAEGNDGNNTQSAITSAGISVGRAAISIDRVASTTSFNPQTVGGSTNKINFHFDAEL